jgi:hypothetical protein
MTRGCSFPLLATDAVAVVAQGGFHRIASYAEIVRSQYLEVRPHERRLGERGVGGQVSGRALCGSYGGKYRPALGGNCVLSLRNLKDITGLEAECEIDYRPYGGNIAVDRIFIGARFESVAHAS